jgi:hypothetical protein
MTDLQESDSPSRAEIRAAVFMAAGAGSAAIMRGAPMVVMPTEEIEATCELILKDLYAGALR